MLSMKNLVYVLAGFLLVMGVYFLLNKEEAMPKVKMTTLLIKYGISKTLFLLHVI